MLFIVVLCSLKCIYIPWSVIFQRGIDVKLTEVTNLLNRPMNSHTIDVLWTAGVDQMWPLCVHQIRSFKWVDLM